jgi:hypothetical protein
VHLGRGGAGGPSIGPGRGDCGASRPGLTTSIFAINVAPHRPVLDALLFSLAIAVGITPQPLPAASAMPAAVAPTPKRDRLWV